MKYYYRLQPSTFRLLFKKLPKIPMTNPLMHYFLGSKQRKPAMILSLYSLSESKLILASHYLTLKCRTNIDRILLCTFLCLLDSSLDGSKSLIC